MSTILQVQGLTRRFGGLTAVNTVSIDLRIGEVHAVIGTNGAGKSTLINMLSGEIASSEGRIQLSGADVTRQPQPRRALSGIGRSYQRTTIFPEFTVHENCRLTAQARNPRPWALWESARKCDASVQAANAALEATGLAPAANRLAGTLSHGAKRQLEVAMCLATQPRVLLLDEPRAGLGAEETDRMLALLERLKPGHASLLVEHTEQALVMEKGQIVLAGDSASLLADPHALSERLGV